MPLSVAVTLSLKLRPQLSSISRQRNQPTSGATHRIQSTIARQLNRNQLLARSLR
jgi:hypothetical protein